jgi:hypothetical protein
MRVLRRFLNSALALLALSDTISIISSAKSPPESFMQTAATPQFFKIARRRLKSLHLLHRVTLRSTFRGWPAVRARYEHPCFLCNPDWTDQQIKRSLEKRRTVSFDAVAEKEKYPSAHKESRSPDPFHKQKQNNPGKNHGNAKAMQELIPSGLMLVVVLSHVVRQARHERTSNQPPCGCPASWWGTPAATV